ncbi:hypothetical protein Gohar_027460 [Gossypium harknessii]|uniref:Uncharacterized protein n=1 Tax=Gossypium harknessii TaxID=34285 RepID=A0A7J9HVG7_9ROSI|nr:hypothetical protein [Gossypium harknessii]
MVNDESSWNLDLFRIWLLEGIVKRIVSIPPPHPSAGLDKIFWTRISNDYPTAKEIWMLALPNGISGRFFVGNLIQWLKANLQSNARSVDSEEDVSRWKEQNLAHQTPNSWNSLCTDGAVQFASENATAGGVIRNGGGE